MKVRLKFEPRDLWVGVFWDNSNQNWYPDTNRLTQEWNIYICLIPMFPVKVMWNRARK